MSDMSCWRADSLSKCTKREGGPKINATLFSILFLTSLVDETANYFVVIVNLQSIP